MAYYIPPPEKLGGHVPRVPHQIAPMCVGVLQLAVWETRLIVNWALIACVKDGVNNKQEMQLQ